MKRIAFLILLFFSTGLLFNSNAQVGNYLKKKAKQATVRSGQKADEEVTDEMNKKVDKEVGKVFNKLFSEDEEESSNVESSSIETDDSGAEPSSHSSSGNDNSDAMAKSMMKAFGISTAPVNVAENYNYSGSILMEVQSWEGDGSTEGIMDYYTFTSKDNQGFAMKFSQPDKGLSTMIFDYENEAMIILTEENGEKSGLVTQYAGMESSMNNSEEIEQDIEDGDYNSSYYNENLKKTGKTKTIAGYKCDEYVYEDEEIKTNMWMTNDLPADLWAKMFSTNVMTAGNYGYYGGFVMEMNQTEKKSKDRVYMLVKEVNQNKNTSISTQGYNLISIGVNPEIEE